MAYNTKNVSFHSWPFAGGSDTTIGVVRTGNNLTFLDMTTDSPTLNLLNQGNNLSFYLGQGPIETAVINNSFIIVSAKLNYPLLLEYDADTDTIYCSWIYLKIRDFYGVEDCLDVNERPTTLTNYHKYNLRNQGWISTIKTSCGSTVDAIDCTYTKLSKYPSNSDIWTLGKIRVATSSKYEKYDPDTLDKNSQRWMQAPRGKYIIDAFNRGASRKTESGITGLPQDAEQGNITTLCSFAGRIFYSGVQSTVSGSDANSPNYSGYVFFTQSVINNEKLSKCYQEADPTDPDISDLIDTDGGTIVIADAMKIVKVHATKSSVLVFAENGIWEIYAGDTGFKATEYQLNKIASIGITNPLAVVEADNAIFYWAKSGIYMLATDSITGRYQAQNISLATIQTFYNEIPETGKDTARGYYEALEGRVRWLFSTNTTDSNLFNRELILDTTLQAFYPLSFDNTIYQIADYVEVPTYLLASTTDTVYVGTEVVTSDAAGTDPVEVTITEHQSRAASFNFLVINEDQFSFASYSSDTFKDWGTVNYSSYLVTGYEMFGDMLRRKQVPEVVFFFKRTESGFDEDLNLENPSSCLVQAQWNWANSINSGKWGTQFQAYRLNRNYLPTGGADPFDYGEDVIITKNRLRGSGRCLSLKIESEEGKDMRILGWAVMMNGNSEP